MTILSSLVEAYDNLPSAPPFGYSLEKIGFAVSLDDSGTVAGVFDLREGQGRSLRPRLIVVPQPSKRASGIAPNFLWDKTAYALGVTLREAKRTPLEHAAFIEGHLALLKDENDAGVRALRLFLLNWAPDQFKAPLWPEAMIDQNIVFCLESEREAGLYLHDRPAIRSVWARIGQGKDKVAVCSVTGAAAPVSRLHPAIKGVWGSQSSGGSLVSFNIKSAESYGHEQGDNGPVSHTATFAYSATLNQLLSAGSRQRLQIGDTSVVFWASEADATYRARAERLFRNFVEPEPDALDEYERDLSRRLYGGEKIGSIDPGLSSGVRIHILGIAPNSARLSVRFHVVEAFERIAARYQDFFGETRIAPPSSDPQPPMWKYLSELSVLGKYENLPPSLCGELMRAILAGSSYPMALLSVLMMRVAADGDIGPRRAALFRAVLIRNFGIHAPVALDPTNREQGYLLGRLFAVYEYIDLAAARFQLKSTIRHRVYSWASSQPGRAFGALERKSEHQLEQLLEIMPTHRRRVKRLKAAIAQRITGQSKSFPVFLSPVDRALFALGYYHQANDFFNKWTDTGSSRDRDNDAAEKPL